MNADERALIDELYDRVRTVADTPRDGEAEALIAGRVRELPFAPYVLTQTVLVQDHALKAAGARIEELEAQLRERPAQPAGGSSFLGGLLGGGAGRSASVPSAGARPANAGGYDYPGRDAAPAQPAFGQSPGQPGAGQPGMGQPGMGQPPTGRFGAGGGGFLQNAMATAAGVAGGALLFSGIQSMLGGGEAKAAEPGAASAADKPADAGATDTPAADTTADATAADAGGNDSFFSNPWGASKEDASQTAAADPNAGADQPDPFPYEENYAADDTGGDDGGWFGGGDSDDSGWA